MFKFRQSPFQVIFLLYFSMILLFSVLYSLPVSQNHHVAFIDAFFLSSSAMSATGLTSISITDDLSTTGQFFLLLQMQLGGIGIMAAFGALMIVLKRPISLPSQAVMTFDQNQKNPHSITKFILFIVGYAFLIECTAFLLFLPSVLDHTTGSYGVFSAFFLAVSSFTNAGFDLFGNGLFDFVGNHTVLLTSTLLIFLGSIGFPIVFEFLFSKQKKKSLFFKANMLVHIFLILSGFLFFLFADFWHSSLYTWGEKISNSLFFSLSARNTGLLTTDVSFFTVPSVLFMMMLMFVGASPSSCGGGIRTSTFAVIFVKIISIAKGSRDAHMFKKSLHEEDVNKAFLVFFSFLTLFFISFFLLCFVEEHSPYALAFEVMSALSTAGLSMGITAKLTVFSKILLSILMVIGRIGIIVLLYTFIENKTSSIKYAKESIIVG